MSRTRVTSERKWVLIVAALVQAFRDGAITLRSGRKTIEVSTRELADSIRRSGGTSMTADALNSFAREQHLHEPVDDRSRLSVTGRDQHTITIDRIRYSVHYERSKWRLEQA